MSTGFLHNVYILPLLLGEIISLCLLWNARGEERTKVFSSISSTPSGFPALVMLFPSLWTNLYARRCYQAALAACVVWSVLHLSKPFNFTSAACGACHLPLIAIVRLKDPMSNKADNILLSASAASKLINWKEPTVCGHLFVYTEVADGYEPYNYTVPSLLSCVNRQWNL